MNKQVLAVVLFAVVIAAAALAAAPWQPSDEPPGRRGGQPDLAARLMEGLQSSPGCLGVEAGRFMSGKQAIIGWFENKAAVVAWYNSPTHRQMVARLTDADAETEPLEHVTDEQTPIMVIATITPAKEAGIEGVALPISQISIELYSPLPGGAFVNGRFAPAGFKVPHLRDYTPPQEEQTPQP